MPKRLVVAGTTMVSVYNDPNYATLKRTGECSIRRASHVEPGTDGDWYADLSPVNGPKLGPFEQRQEALDAEVEWLNEHMVGIAVQLSRSVRAES